MKKLFAIFLSIILALTLCSCKKDDEVIKPETTSGSETEASEVTSATSLTEEEVMTSLEEETTVSTTEEEITFTFEITTEQIVNNYRAMECIDILNSHNMHAKFTEALSYDGEYVMGYEREMYISNGTAVYLEGEQKIIMTPELVTIIDYETETYFSYENETGEIGEKFGYGKENYVNILCEEKDGVLTEGFVIFLEDSTITSTWTFEADGTITVMEKSDASDGYTYYIFEILSSEAHDVDTSVPEHFTEESPEDYEIN